MMHAQTLMVVIIVFLVYTSYYALRILKCKQICLVITVLYSFTQKYFLLFITPIFSLFKFRRPQSLGSMFFMFFVVGS